MSRKRKKLEKVDGLGPVDIKRLRSAIRKVWHHSHARKLVTVRCTGKDGFMYCEKCKERTPSLKIDHIIKCGDVDGGYIARMFCPSTGLQGLCPECHSIKGQLERDALGTSRRKRKSFTDSF